MHCAGHNQGQLRFMASRLASVLTLYDRVLGRPRLPNLQMAKLVCLSRPGGAFPGIKMRSHDMNRVCVEANALIYTFSPCRGRGLTRTGRCANRGDSAPHHNSLKTYTIFSVRPSEISHQYRVTEGADDYSLVSLGRLGSTCR